MLFFAAFFVYYAVTGPSTSTTAKTFACLLAPTCLGLGSDVIAAFEGGLIGASASQPRARSGADSSSLS